MLEVAVAADEVDECGRCEQFLMDIRPSQWAHISSVPVSESTKESESLSPPAGLPGIAGIGTVRVAVVLAVLAVVLSPVAGVNSGSWGRGTAFGGTLASWKAWEACCSMDTRSKRSLTSDGRPASSIWFWPEENVGSRMFSGLRFHNSLDILAIVEEDIDLVKENFTE